MPGRFIRVVVLIASFVFLVAACGGDDNGGDSGGSADLEKWIPAEVDGKELERKEVTLPESGDSEESTTTAPPEGESSNTSTLGQSLATSLQGVEAIAVGEIPGSADSPLTSQGMPALFVGAVQSSKGAEEIEKSLSTSAPGSNVTTREVEGIKVTTLEFDMAASLQGQQLPEGTPALPKITIEYFTPQEGVVVVVFSTESKDLADAAVEASIASGK